MLALSFVFGGADHEVDHDSDHETDHDHGGGNMSILSFKVFWMFLVGFGAGGYFSSLSGTSVIIASLWGLFGGLVMGAIGYFLMNYLYKRQGNSVVRTSSVIGSTAIVDTTILPGQIGEVRCSVDGRSEYFQARSRIGTPIPVASRVRVIETTGSMLVVEPDIN